jgi:hypothetical protein
MKRFFTALSVALVAGIGMALPSMALTPKIQSSAYASLAQPGEIPFAEQDSEVWFNVVKGSLKKTRDTIKRTTVYCDGTIRELTYWTPNSQQSTYFAPTNTPAGRPMDSQFAAKPFKEEKQATAAHTRNAWPSTPGFNKYKKFWIKQQFVNKFGTNPTIPKKGDENNVYAELWLLKPVKPRNLCQVKVTKAFNPPVINEGDFSTMTFTFTPVATVGNQPASTNNVPTNADPMVFSQPLGIEDDLPKGVVATGVTSKTCKDGLGKTANSGSTVSYEGLTPPTANLPTPCTVSFEVKAACGKYLNDKGNVVRATASHDYNAMSATLEVVNCGNATNGNGNGSSSTTLSSSSTSSSSSSSSSSSTSTTVVSSVLPKLTKYFNPAAVTTSQGTTLNFVIENPAGSPAKTGLSFTDLLPPPMTAVGAVVVSQCGGVVTTGTTVSLAGGSIAAGPSTCLIRVNIADALPCGLYKNLPVGPLAGTGQVSAVGLDTSTLSAQLDVGPCVTTTTSTSTTTTTTTSSTIPGGGASPCKDPVTQVPFVCPKATKAFSSPVLGPVGYTSTLTITITNTAPAYAWGPLAFTDVLPAIPSLPNGAGAPYVVASNNCGGTATVTSGPAQLVVSGAQLSASMASCTITVKVLARTCGNIVNQASLVTGTSYNLDTSGLNASVVLPVPAGPTCPWPV